jgi:hypothetical protein
MLEDVLQLLQCSMPLRYILVPDEPLLDSKRIPMKFRVAVQVLFHDVFC